MTLKQGDDINKRFISLTDSIKLLNSSLTSLELKSKDLDSSLAESKSKLNASLTLNIISEEEIKRLNKIIEENEKYFVSERRSWAGWMLFSVLVTVVVGAVK